ncbi:MAG: recombinase family protein [Defluviitaleaceae bacterium]|nr:recombinase family protein [Defluviitaleaceae bacterium]
MSGKLYNVGVYIRLSQADKRADESVSVENQRAMLSQFVSHMPNWILARTYVDEGVSGGNFDRKGFRRMMEDVRGGIINLVLVKDLSRFGRNYLEAGRYIEEELPTCGCRFVALCDNIDTETGDNDILPFLNVMNDFYLRDCSERVKAGIRARAQDGRKLSGVAPYGYVRKPDDRSRLAVDEAAATIVRRIFTLRADGLGYTAIAGILNRDGVAAPVASIWATRTVKLMLNNEVYIGNTVSLKRGTRSYRDSRTFLRDEREWVRADNTHAPIIERPLWNNVQQMNLAARAKMANARAPRPNLFAGLLVCRDCGMKMNRAKNLYHCSTYRRSGNAACSKHEILEGELKKVISLETDRAALTSFVEKIEVGEKFETNGQTHQDIRIFYKSVEVCRSYP